MRQVFRRHTRRRNRLSKSRQLGYTRQKRIGDHDLLGLAERMRAAADDAGRLRA
jgi:hypothetical protein